MSMEPLSMLDFQPISKFAMPFHQPSQHTDDIIGRLETPRALDTSPLHLLRSARLLILLCLVLRLMVDLFVLISRHPDLTEARVVAVEADVEVDAVDEVVSIVEDEVADVALAADVEVDVEEPEVAVAEGMF